MCGIFSFLFAYVKKKQYLCSGKGVGLLLKDKK